MGPVMHNSLSKPWGQKFCWAINFDFRNLNFIEYKQPAHPCISDSFHNPSIIVGNAFTSNKLFSNANDTSPLIIYDASSTMWLWSNRILGKHNHKYWRGVCMESHQSKTKKSIQFAMYSRCMLDHVNLLKYGELEIQSNFTH